MIHFVFRKSVKTHTKTGYRIIIFLGNVLLVSCALPSVPELLYLLHSFILTHYYTYRASFVAVTVYPLAVTAF